MSRPEGECHDPCLCCRRACPDPCRRFATAGHRAAHARGGLAPGPGDRRLGPRPPRPRHPRGLPHRHPARARAGADAAGRPPAHRRHRPPADAVGRRRHGFGARQRPLPVGARGRSRARPPRPGAPPARSSGAARAGRSSAASACRMPAAPGCGAGRDRGASIRSACCRCGPAPLPCATPSPTCWAGSICARSWRTPTRADAGPAPPRCAHHRPPRPRRLPRLPTGRSNARDTGGPGRARPGRRGGRGGAWRRSGQNVRCARRPHRSAAGANAPMIQPQGTFCPLPARTWLRRPPHRACSRRGVRLRARLCAPAMPRAGRCASRAPWRHDGPPPCGHRRPRRGRRRASTGRKRTFWPVCQDLKERRRPTSPQQVRPSPHPKRTQWPPPASRSTKRQARRRSRRAIPRRSSPITTMPCACARDQEVFAEIDEEFAPKLDALAREHRARAHRIRHRHASRIAALAQPGRDGAAP